MVIVYLALVFICAWLHVNFRNYRNSYSHLVCIVVDKVPLSILVITHNERGNQRRATVTPEIGHLWSLRAASTNIATASLRKCHSHRWKNGIFKLQNAMPHKQWLRDSKRWYVRIVWFTSILLKCSTRTRYVHICMAKVLELLWLKISIRTTTSLCVVINIKNINVGQ